ncbi:MAG: SUMF1/EgtB/PvdO family nonheme iron enzyme [Thiofilum sp.]|uniref:SUMF1/EgtB/PvdO family nonheme iron enzyme n=1 Tax=Thiofilum sp. TaxID=2212733 RepID=UPI0025EADEFB|nr:SUMF1/EgtB/PvdO family nonheme iron enzyme [Thiofilum sp.]MBK8452282.1 SUMF1/EgtB/PvdO family nonheme iron enzyme [Thiofilum sp.]
MTDIFISYSHQDEIWKDELQKQLRVLQVHGQFAVWDDRQIEVGDEWLPAIEAAIAKAKVAVLLISADFLTSNFIARKEIPKLLERRKSEGLRIIPVIVHPCPWRRVPWLATVQGATVDNQALSLYAIGSYELNRVLSTIVEKIDDLLLEAKQEAVQKQAEAQRLAQERLAQEAEARRLAELQAKREAEAQQQAEAQAAREREAQRVAAETAQREAARQQAAELQRQAEQQARTFSTTASPLRTKPVVEGNAGRVNKWFLGGVGSVAAVGVVWLWVGTKDPEPRAATVSDTPPVLVAPTPVVTEQPIQPAKAERLPFEPVMVDIPAGTFTMVCVPKRDVVEGMDKCYGDELPFREVTVKAYQLAKTEVTVAQFRAFVEATNYKTTAEEQGSCYSLNDKGGWGDTKGNSWRQLGFKQTDNDPVACVSWNDAQAYIQWLKKETGKPYRLPSEAEWEYAARAGSDITYLWGQNASLGCQFANLADQKGKEKYPSWTIANCNDSYVYTAPVASYAANSYGLYDMHGNVWEWVADCYANPSDSINCSRRVFRGGSWNEEPDLSSAYRSNFVPTSRLSDVGFRVAAG